MGGGGEGVAGISQGRFLYVCACVCGRADEVLWVRDTVTGVEGPRSLAAPGGKSGEREARRREEESCTSGARRCASCFGGVWRCLSVSCEFVFVLPRQPVGKTGSPQAEKVTQPRCLFYIMIQLVEMVSH